MRARVITDLSTLDRGAWDALAGANPFVSYDYLATLEATGCVGRDRGWAAHHIALTNGSELVGAMPLYVKHDSWGEFVFDFAWAQAYREHGLDYYPKLVSAVPFTPVTGPRLLYAANGSPDRAATRLIDAATNEVDATGASSLHVLFPAEDEVARYVARDMLPRQDCQFHWRNRGYASFDDFLATFRSRRRKKVLRERRHVRDAGITFDTLLGSELDSEDWRDVYAFYASSFVRRGRRPYFPMDFFPSLASRMGERIMIKRAMRDGRAIAAAIFFLGPDTLYGRYWGATEYHDSLHFETCYYQGIEYCIEHGLAQFDPGTQGEHKIARGFEATATWSAHRLAESGFHTAVADYLTAERRHVRAYMNEVDRHLPFRRDDVSQRAERR